MSTRTAGIDVGSTYTKAIILDDDNKIVGKGMTVTDSTFQKPPSARTNWRLNKLGYRKRRGVSCDGPAMGASHPFRDVYVTDITAQARGAPIIFPKTKTVLDVGGQTMKTSRSTMRQSALIPSQRQMRGGYRGVPRKNRALYELQD